MQLSHDHADLDAIDPSGGALRQAAQVLARQAGDTTQGAEAQRVARSALSLLYGFAAGEDA